MKKILLTVLLLGVISLVGCGKNDKTVAITNPDGTKTTTVISSDGKQTVTVTSPEGKVMSIRTK